MDEYTNKKDQWKLDGDCSVCRKRTYCSHECNASKKSTEKFIEAKFIELMTRRMMNKDDKESDAE